MPKRRASTERPPDGADCVCIIHSKDAKPTDFVYFAELPNPQERFKSIYEIRDARLFQPVGSPHRQENVCAQIPTDYGENHGYHRECYQRFTMNLKRLKPASDVKEDVPLRRSCRSSSADDKDKVIFSQNCIFCKAYGPKKVLVHGSWTTEGLSNFCHGGGDVILPLAETRGDEELASRIRGFDLFACEARYHKHCRMRYVDKSTWLSQDEEARQQTEDLQKTHESCFAEVCETIDRRILIGKEVMKMTDLRDMYVEHLSRTQFANPNYRTQTLKQKLANNMEYDEKLSFVALDRKGGRIQSELVFSSDFDLATAVKNGFVLGSTDNVDSVAIFLHKCVTDAFAKADEMPWPPTAAYLESIEDPVPESLKGFLRALISGKNVPRSDKTERLVFSIGQDICRAATAGKWKLSKHILICMTLRHLFRSAQLNTLMNRLGHAESYTFALELETALAVALDEASTILTPQIVRNPTGPSLFHSDFDNFDQFVNDLSGSGSVHTSHGIMLQNILQATDIAAKPVIPSIPKTGIRSLVAVDSESLPPCYINQRDCPKMIVQQLKMPNSHMSRSTSELKNLTWCIIRILSSAEGQCVPGWAGFISEVGKKPENLTTIDYYPVVNHPITENSTVQECLRMSKQATDEVGQMYCITTLDLGVCMKAFPIIWKSPSFYKDHIIMIGSFHLVCAYLKMVGKKMTSSGFSEVLLESGLMSSGSMQGVLSGKNYSRAMYCHKAMAEGLERLLVKQFCVQKGSDSPVENLPPSSKAKLNQLCLERNQANLEEVFSDTAFQTYLSDYSDFRRQVGDGAFGQTAQFWLSYVDHIWLVLSLLNAVKTNDYSLYVFCVDAMADLFFSFDGQNYARYLTYFSLFLTNIEETHPGATELLECGAIGVARSAVPGNLCAVDKTIEETFMKHAKSHAGAGGKGAGVSGLLNNYEAYKRWAKTAHERSRYLDVTLQMADMADESKQLTKHRDLRISQILKSESATIKVMEAVESFINPFATGQDGLLCITSGASVPPDIRTDLLDAEKQGKLAKDAFINDRLKQNKDFFEPIKKTKLKTYADMNKTTKVKTTGNKTIMYKQQGNLAFQLLVKSQSQPDKLDLRELLRFPLMPVPSAIGTPDGYLLKTDKSKGYHYLTKKTEDANQPPDKETLNVEDGNAIFHSVKDVPRTFKQISQKIFDISTAGKSNVVFSTDMYKEKSIKSLERMNRGDGERRIIQGENTRRPEDWKGFLSNDTNKQQMVNLMLRVWSSPDFNSKLQNKEFVAVCEGKAYWLTSNGEAVEIQALHSDQEETDTRVILYCSYADQQGYKFVRNRSPDTDIFFILLYYAPKFKLKLLFDTGYGNKRRLMDITEMAQEYTQDYRAALLGLHAYTRCDTTSAFKGIGKVKPIKLLQKKPKYHEVFKILGESWAVSDELFLLLEESTCKMYRTTNTKEVDKLRFEMLLSKCGGSGNVLNPKKNVDLSTVPPPRVCLQEHIRRVNFQVGIWKRAHVACPPIPDPTDGHGWITGEDQRLEPKWYEGAALPPTLADILVQVQDERDRDGEASDTDSDEYSSDEGESSSSSDSDQ